MTAPHPEAALSAREAEKIADPRDRYYGENGAVWKSPIETRKENGTTSISIGFKVCTMTDVVGPEAADTVADLMNAGVAALSTAHTATAGDGGEERADATMRTIWAEWVGFYNRHFRGAEGISLADQMAFYEIAQPVLRALAQAPAVQAPAGEEANLAVLKLLDEMIEGVRSKYTTSDIICAALASPTPTDAQPKAAKPVGDEALRGARDVANVMEALWLEAEQEAARLASGFWPSDGAIAEAFHKHRRETQPSLPPWSEVMEGSGIWQHSHNFAARLSSLRPSQQPVGEI